VQELKWTQKSLSLVTIWFGVISDLGEDLISLVVSRIQCYSSCKCWKVENLDAIECGVVGVFIAPTTKSGRWKVVCRMAHRTVWCATGHCPVRQPRQPSVGFWPLELWLVGPLGCPVVRCAFCACSVLCTRRRALNALQSTVACEVVVAPLAHRTVRCDTRHCPMLHRTVRWIIAERPPIFPKVASLASSSLVHRTVRCARPGCLLGCL
jgi:hypothetical protein